MDFFIGRGCVCGGGVVLEMDKEEREELNFLL